jgi:hypothetical protein
MPSLLLQYMVRTLQTVGRSHYVSSLSVFIYKEIVKNRHKITFLDCMNKIDQYMFPRKDVRLIMENLFLGRMERFFDFYEQLRCIQFNKYFWKSEVLLISSYHRLMDDLNDEEKIHFGTKVKETFQRIEDKYGKQVTVIETA